MSPHFAMSKGACSGIAPTCVVSMTTDISVSADFEVLSSCMATRSTPSYIAGQKNTIMVDVTPPGATLAYALEETPPSSWTVSDISHGGSFDGTTQNVKWAPFFDSSARSLTYKATPPTCTTGSFPFVGTVSVDGGIQGTCDDTSASNGAIEHPGDGESGTRAFVGTASFDGTNVSITGQRTIEDVIFADGFERGDTSAWSSVNF